MAEHRHKKPLSMVGLGALTVSIALFVGVFIATSPDDIPDSTSTILAQDQGVPDDALPTPIPTYKGRYRPEQKVPSLSTGTAAPTPSEKDAVIRIDVVEPPKPSATVTSVAAKPTVVPVPKTTVAPPPKTTVAPPPKTTVAPPPKTTVAPPPEPVTPRSTKCDNIGVAPNVEVACNKVLAAVMGIPAVGGFGQRPGNGSSCHPQGLALDFMVYNNKALGDRVYEYVKANRAELGASPVILWQTSDHYDHVHVSFLPCRG